MADKIEGAFGDRVRYVDRRSHTKLALVTADPSTVSEGEHYQVPHLAEDERHLLVLSPSGQMYARQNVQRRPHGVATEVGERSWEPLA